jgi:hypothetical protein
LILARPTLRPTRPLRPASPLAAPSPAGQKRPAGPSSPCVCRVFAGNTFSFSDHAFPSRPPPPSVTATWAPLVSFIVSPAPTDPGWNFPSAAAPRRRCLAPWMPPSFYSSPSSLPPLNPLQTERSRPLTPSMLLKPLTSALTALATPPRCSPGPYKRRAPSLGFTTPLPAHISLSPHLSNSLIERRRLPALHRRRPSSSMLLEHR